MNLEASELALMLLLIRVLSGALLLAVIARQIHNIRTLHTDFPAVRYGVLALTVVLFLGHFIPMALDYAIAFGGYVGIRTVENMHLTYLYTFNNAINDVVVGILLAFLHFRPTRQAEPPRDIEQAL